MIPLTKKQKEVVEMMKKTGGKISESVDSRHGQSSRIKREVLYRDGDVYTVVMSVHKRTFEALIEKGAIQYMPEMWEDRDGWMRVWWRLAE